MRTKRIFSIALLLGAFAPAFATAQETPRTMEPPPATAERDSQLAPIPPARPASAATPAEAEAVARARAQGQQSEPPPPEPKADARPTPPTPPNKGQSARKNVPKRRAVEQVLTPTPRITGSATPAPAGPLVYGPSLETRATDATAAATAAAAARPTYGPSLQPTNPAICSGPNCFNGNGQRIGTGIGNTAVTPQGRLCTQGLAGLQCF